ncbi:hypothetical protein LCGC14_0748390 [marine sediment metagenome]|uniref:Uncharacterized protein n=1 Tax=marine sediment metagenome TaxID=412755 RepID=A0A0F9SPP4_9ZZZZ
MKYKDNVRRIVIPTINLAKFYRVCAYQKITPSSIGLTEKSFKRYINLKDYLFGKLVKAESFNIFIEVLRNSILSKIISKSELLQLANRPLNPSTIKRYFENKGNNISNSSTKALLSLMLKIHLIDQLVIIKSIRTEEGAEHDKELIRYYILRRRSFISVKELKNKFSDFPRKHKINDYLLELWVDQFLDIGGLDVPRLLCNNYNFKNLDPEQMKEYKSIEKIRVRETGELKVRVVIEDSYKLYPLDKRDEKSSDITIL